MFADETETPMTPAELAERDQLYAAGADENRRACVREGHATMANWWLSQDIVTDSRDPRHFFCHRCGTSTGPD